MHLKNNQARLLRGRFWTSAFFSLLLSFSAFDSLAQSLIRSFNDGELKIDLTAEHAEYELDGNWATFTGNVVIVSGGRELRADRVRFNSLTHDAEAVGKVTLINEDGGVWTGENLNLNLNKRAVMVKNLAAFYNPFIIEADTGKVSEAIHKDGSDYKVYAADAARFTTCTNDPSCRHYSVKAKDIRVRENNDLRARHAVTYLFGVPIFYWPYFWKDLKRHYGFRFEPGYRSKWGAYLLTTYKFPLYRGDDGSYIDSRTSLDYRSKRGLAYGERLNWDLSKVGTGWASAYFIDDDDPDPTVEDPERYRFRFNHAFKLSPKDRVLAQAIYVSDDEVLEDFFEKEYHTMSQPESYLSYTHTANTFSLGLLARPRLNDFYTQVERLPEAWLNINQTEIGETGIYYESENAASFLRKEYDERIHAKSGKDPAYDTGRFDTWHQLSRPFKAYGFLNLIPRAAYRGTYYSKTRETYSTTDFNGTNTVKAVGVRDGDADFRNVIELGLEASLKAYGMWESADGTLWRHVIEPYANYTYIPEPDVLPEKLYKFDDIDEIDLTHTVRIGLRQRWQYKAGESAKEVAMVDLYANFLVEPDEDKDENNLDSVCLDSCFYPASWLRWEVDGIYDAQESEISEASTRMVVKHDIFDADIEYRYYSDDCSLLLGGVVWSLSDEWSMSLYGRYEFEEARVEKIGGYLQREFDCIGFRLCTSIRPEHEYDDGTIDEEDFRISLLGWLTHFPPDSLSEADYR